MIAEIGQFALILSLLLAAAQTIACLWGAQRGEPALMALGRTAALLQLGFVVTAFGALAASYLANDFSVSLVAQHSNSQQPLVYRFAATWGSHEGSMLLWVLILSLYSGALAVFGHRLRETLQARVLGVQALIATAFLSFSLFTSNPFTRLDPAPIEGSELNPLLQDPGLTFHPPMLYLGYVGFSMAFSFAIAALIEGRVDAGWARWIRPWVLASWICLTIGVTAGSWWAYYTLGWGGWWFWDPVENASLMPWLMGTALLHSSLVLERRGALVSWTILLAILTFSMSLIGTFLVRSGVLTSVHAFASDPRRGIYILGIIAGATGTALSLYAWRVPRLKSGALFAPVSREAGITLNNLFLLTLTATVFLGTFYPIFVQLLSDQRISVGPPFYHWSFVPIAVPLLLLVSFGGVANWKRSSLRDLAMRLRWPLLTALGGFLLVLVLLFVIQGFKTFGWDSLVAAFGLALGLFLVMGALAILAHRWRREGGLGRLLRTTPLPVWGLVLAHAGLGLTVIGITGVSEFQSSKVLAMTEGQSVQLAGYAVRLDAVRTITGPNYEANRALFSVESALGERVLVSERRFFPGSQTQTTKAAIGMSVLGNTYISVGDRADGGGIVVRMWDHPLVDWIWAGGLLMALGGAISLADRRVRVGAASRVPQALAVTA